MGFEPRGGRGAGRGGFGDRGELSSTLVMRAGTIMLNRTFQADAAVDAEALATVVSFFVLL